MKKEEEKLRYKVPKKERGKRQRKGGGGGGKIKRKIKQRGEKH